MHYVATKICQASEIGYNGNLFGGIMLSWLDEAGAAFAGYLCHTPNLVTLKMNEVLFKRPVKIGYHVRIYARVVHVGSSSISVMVEARRLDFDKELEEIVCSTNIVYVKINAQGEATPIDERLRKGIEIEGAAARLVRAVGDLHPAIVERGGPRRDVARLLPRPDEALAHGVHRSPGTRLIVTFRIDRRHYIS